MKIKILVLLFSISPLLIYSQNTRVEHSFYLHDLSSGKDILFNEIFETYNLDTNLPTLLIFWANAGCGNSCTDILNRYAQSKMNKFNLVLVNMDGIINNGRDTINGSSLKIIGYEKNQKTESILKKAEEKLSNATHFHIYSKKGGVDTQLDVTSRFPYLLYFDKNLNPLMSQAGTDLFPSVVFPYFHENALEYFKSSPRDVIDYSFPLVVNDSLNQSEKEKLKVLLLENEKKVRNNLYQEEWLEFSESTSSDLTKIKLYYCMAKIEFLMDNKSVSNAYLQTAIVQFDKKFERMVTNESDTYYKKRAQEKLEPYKMLLDQLSEQLR